jgi:hypothetical protein
VLTLRKRQALCERTLAERGHRAHAAREHQSFRRPLSLLETIENQVARTRTSGAGSPSSHGATPFCSLGARRRCSSPSPSCASYRFPQHILILRPGEQPHHPQHAHFGHASDTFQAHFHFAVVSAPGATRRRAHVGAAMTRGWSTSCPAPHRPDAGEDAEIGVGACQRQAGGQESSSRSRASPGTGAQRSAAARVRTRPEWNYRELVATHLASLVAPHPAAEQLMSLVQRAHRPIVNRQHRVLQHALTIGPSPLPC